MKGTVEEKEKVRKASWSSGTPAGKESKLFTTHPFTSSRTSLLNNAE